MSKSNSIPPDKPIETRMTTFYNMTAYHIKKAQYYCAFKLIDILPPNGKDTIIRYYNCQLKGLILLFYPFLNLQRPD